MIRRCNRCPASSRARDHKAYKSRRNQCPIRSRFRCRPSTLGFGKRSANTPCSHNRPPRRTLCRRHIRNNPVHHNRCPFPSRSSPCRRLGAKPIGLPCHPSPGHPSGARTRRKSPLRHTLFRRSSCTGRPPPKACFAAGPLHKCPSCSRSGH